MLIYAGRKHIPGNDTRATEGDTIAGKVQQDVIRTQSRTASLVRLFVRYECESVGVKSTIKDVLASYKREVEPTLQIGIGAALRRRSRADFCCDLGQGNHRPARVVIDRSIT